ncbi:11364_t:CDS:2 [Entrophospora sp. SA101]|nr:11364_t:CDS:2 [Entrophospora sp. SA101]
MNINQRSNSQESLPDPYFNSSLVTKPRAMDPSQPISVQLQALSNNQPPLNHKKSSPIMRKDNPFKDTPEPLTVSNSLLTADDYVVQAIKFHEEDRLEKSTEYFRIAADKGSPVGMVLYGLALRHGWGCKKNTQLAIEYLSKVAKVAEVAENDIETISKSSHKGELVLAIYELGNCFQHGWGVQKSKSTAARYFQIAADLGDPDAQNEIGHCYYNGEGVKKDMKTAAKYYRLAHEQGHGTMGNSWIFKEKYN